jgi:hypothetical protein
VLVFLLAFEGLLAGLMLVRGFPYFGSGLVPNAPFWEAPIALFHWPAIQVLSLFGLCCGFHNGLVLTHVVRGGHVPMEVSGAALLASANWLCWAIVAVLGWLAWRRRGSDSNPPPEEAAPA